MLTHGKGAAPRLRDFPPAPAIHNTVTCTFSRRHTKKHGNEVKNPYLSCRSTTGTAVINTRKGHKGFKHFASDSHTTPYQHACKESRAHPP